MTHSKFLFVALAGLATTFAGTSPVESSPKNQRYIVEFAPGKAAGGKAALKAAGAVTRLELPRHNAVAAEIADSKLGALMGNPNVRSIEADVPRYPISAVRTEPSGADRGVAAEGSSSPQVVPYGVEMIQAAGFPGDASSDVKVCVIDSGYDITHEDKPGAPIVTGTDDTDGSGPWTEDGSGHGTHVSGTVNALDNGLGVVGVFPSVKMHVVRVFGDDGVWAYSSDLVHAVDDCMAHGAQVINMSLGGELPSVFENRAFLKASKSGVLSIAAAGNGGDGRVCDIWAGDRPERMACKMHYPAGYDSVVSVAAVDEDKHIANFSQINAKVEIAAPGVAVLSTVPTGSVMDVTLQTGAGTSDVVPMDNFEIPTSPVTGNLVDCGLAETADSCGGNAAGKICLIERGGFTFAQKAQSCEAAGGVAAVVFQNAVDPGAVNGTLGDTHVAIPVVGTDRALGLNLRNNYIGTPATLTFAVSDYNYDYFSGTSMATPHVAGGAAILWSRHPQCGPSDIRNAMVATAQDLGARGRDRYFGHGLLQVQDADAYLKSRGCTGE